MSRPIDKELAKRIDKDYKLLSSGTMKHKLIIKWISYYNQIENYKVYAYLRHLKG